MAFGSKSQLVLAVEISSSREYASSTAAGRLPEGGTKLNREAALTSARDISTEFPFSLSELPGSWSTDGGARQQALDFGKLHLEGMESLRRLSAAHGGGKHGMIIGVIEGLLTTGLITAADRARLIELFEAYRDPDQGAAIARIKAVHAAAISDAAASPAALAISSVAVAALEPRTDSDLVDGFLIGYADAAGTLVGSVAGPLGAASTGVQASMAAEHATGH